MCRKKLGWPTGQVKPGSKEQSETGQIQAIKPLKPGSVGAPAGSERNDFAKALFLLAGGFLPIRGWLRGGIRTGGLRVV